MSRSQAAKLPQRGAATGITWPPVRRPYLLAGVSMAALLGATPTLAGGPRSLSPAWFASRTPLSAIANNTAQGQPSMQAVQQSLVNLQRAAQSLSGLQNLQAQARAAAAAAAASRVPDGLAVGGLQPAAGAANAASPNAWINAAQPTQTTGNGHTTVTITQTGQYASLNWQTFNVGRNTTLDFDQSAGGSAASTWVAINRITDPKAQPSQILGQINALGQVYILNPNGIIFGGTAQVNTGALIASSAALSNSQFANFGIYSNLSGTTYQPSFTGATAPIIVEAGAQITTNTPFSVAQSGGFAMLLGSSVQNAGQVTTPDGQTILAAGTNFILRQGYNITDTGGNIAGYTTSTTLGSEVAVTGGGGAAVNTGVITATTGDVTMVGKSVTQAGAILSTTSVSRRGTIHLLTDTSDPNSSVTLAPGSLTYIAPDSSGATASDAQRATGITDSATANALVTQNQNGQPAPLNDQVRLPDQQYESRIEITTGGVVDFQPNSLTLANGGQIEVSAGAPQIPGNTGATGRILEETGAVLDVSGLVGVSLPASANDMTVNIQGYELSDAPVNRDTGLIQSVNVEVDIRQLTEVPASYADTTSDRYYTAGGLLQVSGELGNMQHSIAEWSTLGGTVALSAQEVVTQPGSLVNLAGGTVQYQPGYVAQSWLQATNGQIYNVNTAPASLSYTGVFTGFTVNHPRWNITQVFTNPLIAPAAYYEAGYTVGRDAGTLLVAANTALLEGTIAAGVVTGPSQTNRPVLDNTPITNMPFLTQPTQDPFLLPQSAAPLGGSLLIGNYDNQGFNGGGGQIPFTDTVQIGDDVQPVAATVSTTTPIPTKDVNTTQIPAAVLNASGLATLSVSANTAINVDSSVNLAPGGQVSLFAPAVQITGVLSSPSGGVTVGNINTAVETGQEVFPLTDGTNVPSIILTTGATISTAGLWTNLLLDPTNTASLAFTTGGNVVLDTTGSLTLATGSLIDASAGGAIMASGTPQGAAAGNITLTGDDPSSHATINTAPVVLNGTLRAYSSVSSGTVSTGILTIGAPSIVIGNTVPSDLPDGRVALTPAFFQQGFASYDINGYGDLTDSAGNPLPGVTVAPGTSINVVMPTYQFTAQSQLAPTGSAPGAALSASLLPLYLANPVKATLTQRPGASATPAITLQSDLYLDGSTTPASGGTLSLGTGASITVDPGQSVKLEAYGSLTIDGRITAPGGKISVLNDTTGVFPVDNSYNYLLGLSIWLGPDSVLNASGVAPTALDRFGRPYGNTTNIAGGQIVIGSTTYDSSTATTNAFVFIRPGAVIEAAGAAAVIDPGAGLTQAQAATLGGAREVDGSGGSITVASTEGIYLDGTMRAPTGGPTAAGGSLTIGAPTPLYVTEFNDNSVFIPDALRVPYDIVISQDIQSSVLPSNLQPGDTSFASIPNAIGSVQLSAAQVAGGGFDNLTLFATDSLLFNGNVTLTTGQSIQLIAGAFASTQNTGQAIIKAPYVLLRGADSFNPSFPQGDTTLTQTFVFDAGQALVGEANSVNFSQTPPCLSGATDCTSATFTVQASLIDLQDTLTFGTSFAIPLNQTGRGQTPTRAVDQPGFNAVDLVSGGDIRLLDGSVIDQAAGAAYTTVQTPGDITFDAAQVYPVTDANAIVVAGFNPYYTGTGSPFYQNASITFTGIPGDDPAAPLSAFGSLYFVAGDIEQGGIVIAPEGQIGFGTGINKNVLPFSLPGTPVTTTVNLLPGSITSVSMAGLNIPFGGTTDGVTYTYDGATIVGINDTEAGATDALTGTAGAGNGPAVIVSSQSVSIDGGAVVNLSGGGKLVGEGFIPGRGGSTDTLLTPLLNFTTQTPGGVVNTPSLSQKGIQAYGISPTGTQVYAIVAGPQPAYAPTTPREQSDNGGESIPTVGEQITIPAGVAGLPAGTYTLLPAYYALLPNGYRVQFTAGSAAPASNATVRQSNGSYLTAGTLGFANTGIHTTLPTPFIISPGAAVRTYSQYDEESYSQYIQAQAALYGAPRALLPIDAKDLELTFPSASTKLPALTVDGELLTQGADGGYGSWMYIEAPQLTITGSDTPPSSGPASPSSASPSAVLLSAAQIDALGAQTLQIGGDGAGQNGNIGFNGNVVLQSGATLSASQVFLIGDQITLEPGSGIDTLNNPATPATLMQGVIFGQNLNYPSILAASNGALTLAQPNGTGSISLGTCAAGDTCGTAPVLLLSQQTVAISSLGAVSLSPNVVYGSRSVALDVGTVNAGSDAALATAEVPPGLMLSSAELASLVAGDPSIGLPGLQTLTISASQSVNFYGTVDLSTIDPATGQSSLQQLVLETPAIYGFGGPNDVATLRTAALVWNDVTNTPQSGAATAVQPPAPYAGGPGTGTGTLDIIASQITFGYPSGSVVPSNLPLPRQVLGFSTVNLTGTSQITTGNQGSLAVYQTQTTSGGTTTQTGGTLNLITPLLSGTAGSVFSITAGNAINLSAPDGIAPANADQAAATAALGATLTLRAGSISDSTSIALPSGSLSMTASSGNVTLGAGSQISLIGQTTTYFDESSYSWGGTLTLASTNGNVTQDASGLIDVSAINNNAGSIDATAMAGQVALEGALNGTATPGYTAGSITVQTGTMAQADFVSLNQRLNAGGVFGARSFDIGSTGGPGLVIGNDANGNPLLHAHSVSVSVDQGDLEVSGVIDASGATPGSIALAAAGSLTVDGSAVLDAHGTVLQVDSLGQPIQSENEGLVELTAVNGVLTLNAGVTINVGAPGYAAGLVILKAPRVVNASYPFYTGTTSATTQAESATGSDAPTNATGNDVAIDASGPLNILGANSIVLNGFATYSNAPADPSSPTDQFVTQDYLKTIDTDSQDFMAAAATNADLQNRLTGLIAYGSLFHLRPGVEIVSRPGGSLTVSTDLDLSGYRYSDPSGWGLQVNASVAGSGEPGTLVLRAADNLNVLGSITDGFAPPPATPDDNGWTLPTGQATAAPIVYEGSATQPFSVVTVASSGGQTTFPNDTLSYAVTVTKGTLLSFAASGEVVPVEVTLQQGVSVSRSTGLKLNVPITLPNGDTIPANTTITLTTLQRDGYGQGQLPAGTVLGAGFKVPSSGAWVVSATWPADTSLAAFNGTVASPVTILLSPNDVIPTGTVYQGGTAFQYRSGQIWAAAAMLPPGSLSWSLQLVAGADLGAANSATLQPASVLAASATASDPTPGSIVLDDPHTGVNGLTLPSVIRTGTGSLQLLADDNITEASLYGIYTAGTQSQGVDPADNVRLGSNPLGAGSGASGYNDAVAGYQAYYPTDGGNLTLSAQGSITGFYVDSVTVGSTPLPDSGAIGDWLWRQGGDGTPAAWWINFGTYTSLGGNVIDFVGFTGVGTLGGGNLAVSAGGNASGLTLAVASTGRIDGGSTEILTGGGTLSLTVGGAINPLVANASPLLGDAAGTLTDLRGDITVTAGSVGSVQLVYGGTPIAGDPRPANPYAATTATERNGPIIVVGDGTASISTLDDLVLGGAGDATREQQQNQQSGQQTGFSLWQPGSGISLFSAGGNIAPIEAEDGGNATQTDHSGAVYPPTLNIVAPSGSLYLSGDNNNVSGASPAQPSALELAPSAQGNLTILVDQSIFDAGYNYGGSVGNPSSNNPQSISLNAPLSIDISGADPNLLPTPITPAWKNQSGTNQPTNADQGVDALFALAPDTLTTNLHANSAAAATIYATNGDIIGFSTGEEIQFPSTTWYVAGMPVRIRAGRDIVALGIASGLQKDAPAQGSAFLAGSLIYNPGSTDVSEIIAGRDILQANVLVAGQGSLYVQAGRNLTQPSGNLGVDFASNKTVYLNDYVLESIGPLINLNPATRDGGADITTLVGTGTTGPDWTAFANLYLDPANLANPTTPLQDQPGKVERTYQTQLLAWLQQRFHYAGSAADAPAYFKALPIAQQRVFLLQVYFDELNISGLDYNNPASRFFKSYLEGNEAVDTLLPGTSSSADLGDLTLTGGSGIRTDFGGNLTLLVPTGSVTLGEEGGLAPPSTAGLLTQGSGDVDIYAKGSVELGQSRVFTTFGGGILIWSAAGDINAGRGAKSTVVFAPQEISYDTTGDIFLAPTVPTTGAGIATLAPIPQVPPGDIDLVAPLGVIDAGEAGIRASGNANLAALAVLNAANIQVQGKASGLPVVAVPNVAAQSAANGAAGAAAQAAMSAASAPSQNLIPSIFIVEVLGFGGTTNQ